MFKKWPPRRILGLIFAGYILYFQLVASARFFVMSDPDTMVINEFAVLYAVTVWVILYYIIRDPNGSERWHGVPYVSWAVASCAVLVVVGGFTMYKIQENAQISILKACLDEKLEKGVSDDDVMRECLAEIQKPKIEQLSACAARKSNEKVPNDVAVEECFREVGITSWDMKAFDRLYEYKMEDVENTSASPAWKQ